MPPLNEDDAPEQTPDKPPHLVWAITVGPDGGELQTGAMDEPATDWSGILRGFGLDPAVFEVIDDTVSMSKWQQSKRLESGDRDTVWLYSYRARFRRRPAEVPEIDLEAIRQRIHRWRPTKRKAHTTDATPSTFVVCWADWQIGKSAGGGVEATIERIHESFDLTVARLRELRRLGRNVERVAILNMGDPTEGCEGQYASQTFTVELTQREQLNLCLDLWANGVAAIEPDLFASVLCNHGEWNRRGGKSITSDSDNAGGYLADTLRRVMATRDIEWSVPHDDMVTLLELSGLHVGLTHGHKWEKGPEEDWLALQSMRLLREHGHEPRLWVTAHRHHVKVDDFGPWWRLQCPSLDGGSKYFADAKGKWATPGTLTFLAGTHDPRGFSDLAVLGTIP